VCLQNERTGDAFLRHLIASVSESGALDSESIRKMSGKRTAGARKKKTDSMKTKPDYELEAHETRHTRQRRL
jgi:hypothetical protein